MKKIIRTATVSISLDILLKGQLAFLKEYYEVVAVSGQDVHLDNVANREGVRTIPLSIQRQISPFKDFISLLKLYKVLRKEKPLIVHSITPKAGLLTMIAAYFAGVPIRIHTFTGLVFPYKKGFLHHLLLFIDKVLCRFATHIIPEGEGVKKDLLAFKVTKKPLKVIANGNVNGIDLDFFNPNKVFQDEQENLKQQLHINATDFVFVFVGRLVSDKGINELVIAFTNLCKQNSNCKLLLVGPFESELDPLNSETLDLISSNKSIISVGFQEDVRPYLAISNVFVFPSHREGFPNVVLQAGAMNLPCIVTDICGSNEIIISNETGIIIPVKNEIAIFDAMQLLYHDKDLFQNLQSKSRVNIVSRFQQELVWNNLLQEYKRLENNV
ncbi:glycosyltransferase family 4 protein [Flavobacterium cheonanense]|uniref:Glycosyltransferase family 4 protein n=1 Tax=Flavobacterium cheonanense TaxID=706183 RepID=A0ABP7VZQ7_9FLAO